MLREVDYGILSMVRESTQADLTICNVVVKIDFFIRIYEANFESVVVLSRNRDTFNRPLERRASVET